MFPVGRYIQRPHPLALFAAVTLVSVAGLAWLSWRVLAQDQALERQRLLDKCELSAGGAVAILTRQLAELQKLLDTASPPIPKPHIAILSFRGESLETAHGLPLPYLPAPPQRPGPPPDRFIEGERLEFRQRQPLQAAEHYQRLAADPEPSVRAGALLRLARVHRGAGQLPQALKAYATLETCSGLLIDGESAEMLARVGKAELFAQQGDKASLRREAAEIVRALSDGRWSLRRGSYELLSEQTRAWLAAPQPPGASPEALAMAAAADTIWRQWKDTQLAHDPPAGRKTLWIDGTPILALWQTQPGRLVLLVAGSNLLETALAPLESDEDRPVTIALEDPNGTFITDAPNQSSPVRAIKTASSTGLPWTVHAIPAGAVQSTLSGQGRLLLAALGLMILFVVTATAFVARSISRELAVARLQSDFVAAVSHEFRSPLTTIMQLSELLARGRVSSPEKSQSFYEMMLRESRRLHTLVEGLLDFGRFESGRYEYRFQPLDIAALTQNVIAEFSSSATQPLPQIEFQQSASPLLVNADREAIGRVLWNLLDNAVKYSPGQPAIWVAINAAPGHAVVSIRDSGIGIPPCEQSAIFAKFVRGVEAKERSIQGTGFGLTMARMIVQAHRGTIEVESAPGRGSTFHVHLPLVKST